MIFDKTRSSILKMYKDFHCCDPTFQNPLHIFSVIFPENYNSYLSNNYFENDLWLSSNQ